MHIGIRISQSVFRDDSCYVRTLKSKCSNYRNRPFTFGIVSNCGTQSTSTNYAPRIAAGLRAPSLQRTLPPLQLPQFLRIPLRPGCRDSLNVELCSLNSELPLAPARRCLEESVPLQLLMSQ